MTRSAAQRSLDAECRALEEGHVARVQADGSVLVTSDTHPGKSYRVTFSAYAVGDAVVFTCTPEGNRAYSDDHLVVSGPPGATPCKHAALVARRLEREGLAKWSPLGATGPWRCTAKAQALTEARLPSQPSDPFIGLPSD